MALSDPQRPCTLGDVHAALNRAADDIVADAQLPDVGVRDALNLLVNATLHYIEHPSSGLGEVVEANYPETELADVLSWIDEGHAWRLFREDPVIGPRLAELFAEELARGRGDLRD